MTRLDLQAEAVNQIRGPDRIAYGMGARSELEAFATRNRAETALIITDAGVQEAGIVEQLRQPLEAAGVSLEVFDEVHSEPKLSIPVKASERLQAGDHDIVIGCGGGSSMDTAKFAAVLADHEIEASAMLGMDNVPGPGRPVACLPTTAGTGSEVTHIGVFGDPGGSQAKRVVYSEQLFADLALLDPALTRSLPPHVAAATGLDALTHAVEAYTTLLRSPYSDYLARQAVELIGESLRPAVHQGAHNHQARYQMQLGAMIAGQAFVNSGLGAVHALSNPLGIHFDLGHGEANATILPHVMQFNLPAERERFGELAPLLATEEHTGGDRAQAAVDAVFALTEDVGIQPSIGQYGTVDEAILEQFVELAFEYSKHNIDRNPRQLSRDDALAIYRSAR